MRERNDELERTFCAASFDVNFFETAKNHFQQRKMPSSPLFRFEILVNESPLVEYFPLEDDLEYPPCTVGVPKSALDRICYVQATPGSEFSVKVTYVGATRLSAENAYCVSLYLDGKRVTGRSLCVGIAGSTASMTGMFVADDMEQPFVLLSN
jgi:hypothetical protein